MNETAEDQKPTKKTLSRVHRIVANAASILASDVTNRISTFITYALVARFLGILEFGQMALGLTLFRSFQLIAVAGVKSFITREVSKDHTKIEKYFINASIVVLITSLLSIFSLRLFTWIMDYSPETTFVITLLSLGLLPYTLSLICDALFQAIEKMQYITYSNLSINLLKVIFVYLLLWQGFNLTHIISLLFFAYSLNLMMKIWFLLRQTGRFKGTIDLRFCIILVKSSTTFLGINGINAAMSSFNIILLSKFTSEIEVGLYNAATQLMVPIGLFFQSVIVSIYPVMCRSFESGLKYLKDLSDRVIEFLLAIVFPAVITLFFLSDTLLVTLYGHKDFSQSTAVLRIIVWTLLLRALAKVLGMVLIACNQEKKTLRILIVDLITLVVFGVVFVSRFGLIGSAITSVLVRVVDFSQHYFQVSRILSKISMRRLVWKPLVAAVGMVIVFIFSQELNIIISTIMAGIVYITVLSGVAFVSAGGSEQFKIQYLYIWSK